VTKEKSVVSFEEKHLISIMMYMSINEECKKMDIYDQITSNPRIPEKLDRLEGMGLIKQIHDPNQRSIIISLTPKGKQVCDLLKEVDRLIKSE